MRYEYYHNKRKTKLIALNNSLQNHDHSKCIDASILSILVRKKRLRLSLGLEGTSAKKLSKLSVLSNTVTNATPMRKTAFMTSIPD